MAPGRETSRSRRSGALAPAEDQTARVRGEREDGTAVGQVWAALTRREAFDLLEALVFYFAGEEALSIANMLREAYSPEDDPGWHTHLGEGDELTLTIELGGTEVID
jgi:hypothetical protein